MNDQSTPLIPQALGMEDDRSLVIVRTGAEIDLLKARAKLLGAMSGLLAIVALALLVGVVLAVIWFALNI